MEKVKAKKHLGQHFLKNDTVALDIVNGLTEKKLVEKVIEIGPGMGVLSKFLLEDKSIDPWFCEIDLESVDYLLKTYPEINKKIIAADFLRQDLNKLFDTQFGIIGNFPYNISTEIIFKVLEYKAKVPIVVGMFQKEVAERFASKHGSKVYGVTSVLAQAFYDIEYLFTVEADQFIPPPKVKSGVIRLIRKESQTLTCNEKDFIRVVKLGFNQRRKTLRNALSSIIGQKEGLKNDPIFDKRAEQLSVQDFINLTQKIYE